MSSYKLIEHKKIKEEFWTQCQICRRQLATIDSTTLRCIFEDCNDVDFCIQCAYNFVTFEGSIENIDSFTKQIQLFKHFLGLTNVFYTCDVERCILCGYYIRMGKRCCDTCIYNSYKRPLIERTKLPIDLINIIANYC